MNVIARPEFKLACYDIAIQHVSHNVMESLSNFVFLCLDVRVLILGEESEYILQIWP